MKTTRGGDPRMASAATDALGLCSISWTGRRTPVGVCASGSFLRLGSTGAALDATCRGLRRRILPGSILLCWPPVCDLDMSVRSWRIAATTWHSYLLMLSSSLGNAPESVRFKAIDAALQTVVAR
jgi:hypothetical protein